MRDRLIPIELAPNAHSSQRRLGWLYNGLLVQQAGEAEGVSRFQGLKHEFREFGLHG